MPIGRTMASTAAAATAATAAAGSGSGVPTASPAALFRQACAQARRPMAIAGAGLSAASGIPTFRGPSGLWRSNDPLSLATPQAFNADPSKVWQFYHWRRELCLSSLPNPAHEVLSWLSSREGHEATFSSAVERFRLVTQNVDGLSKRSNDSLAKSIDGGNMNVDEVLDPLEMHGSLFLTTCTSCGDKRWNFDSPICEGLTGTEDLSRSLGHVPVEELPRCKSSSCNATAAEGGLVGLLRPGVVWFGESIPLLSTIEPLIEGCDLLLVLGTSSTVYPAAGFAQRVKENGGRVAVFDVDKEAQGRGGEGEADWFFEGRVEEELPRVLGLRS